MAMAMRVAVLTSEGFRLEERPVPEPGPGQVLIRTQACGVCEGDVVHYQARGAGEVVMGHEGTGEIVALGQGVTGLAEGQMVTALGGAYAEFFAVGAEQVLPVPAGMAAEDALGEPIACCIHAADRFGIRAGERVAVIGCGFMGLTCLQLARLQGAAQITAYEPISWRREMALRLGADEALPPPQRPSRPPNDGAYDVVIEATGAAPAVDLAGDLVRQHGRVVLVGYHQTGEGLRTLNMKQWNFKAIDVVMGHIRRRDWKLEAMRRGLELAAAGRLEVAPLVQAYPLADVAQAFTDLVERKEGLYKVVLVP